MKDKSGLICFKGLRRCTSVFSLLTFIVCVCVDKADLFIFGCFQYYLKPKTFGV